MLTALYDAVRGVQSDELAFNIATEVVVMKLEAGWDAVDIGDDQEEVAVLENWVSDGSLSIIRQFIEHFDLDTQARLLDGELDDRGLEVICGGSDLKTEIQYELEIALRNEAAYRLTERGVFPDNGFGTRLKDQ